MTLNIYQKLIEARKAVPYLKKENSGYQYNYVSSSQVLGNLKAKMDELGLLLIPNILSSKVTSDTYEKKDKRVTDYFTEVEIEFTWVNAENPSEKITCRWYGQGLDASGEKGVGKALTYAEKYFLLKFFNIPTDKDDPDSFQRKLDEDPGKGKDQKQEDKKSNNQSPKVLTDPQIKRLYAIAKEHNTSPEQVKVGAKKYYDKDDIKTLTKAEYDDLINRIQNAS